MEATAKKAAVGQPGRRSQNADRCIGARIRERRMMLGLTQQELAGVIGTTAQQVNKYENSINRIFAGRLHILAKALGVEVNYFYQGMTVAGAFVERPAEWHMLLELTRNFLGIRKRAHQEALCTLTRELSGEPAAAPVTAREEPSDSRGRRA